MKQIFQDILKPEEEALGFTPGEPDDDTFLLESQQSYPVDIPDYEQNETVIADDPIPDKPFEQPIYEVPAEGSVWDVFDQEQPEEKIESTDTIIDDEQTADEDLSQDVPALMPDDDTAQSEIDASDESDESNEYLFADDIELAQDEAEPSSIEAEIDDIPELESIEAEIDDIPELESIEAEEVAAEDVSEVVADENIAEEQEIAEDNLAVEEQPIPDEPITDQADDISLDDDFLKSLKSELDNKPRKQKSETPEPIVQADDKPLFEATDEKGGDETFVDISALEFDKPSNISSVKESEKPEKPIDSNNDKNIEKELPKKSKDDSSDSVSEKEKKQRRAIPWWNITVAAASFILLFVVGTGGYFAWNKFAVPMFGEKDNMELVSQKIVVSDEKEDIIAEEKTEIKEEIVEKVEIIQQEKPKVAQQEVKPAAPKPVAPKSAAGRPAVRNETAPASRPPAKARTAPPSKPAATRVEPQKPVDNLAVATQTKPEVATSQKQPETEIYTVQVYATPSAEDASMWLRQLADRNIEGGYISPQKIRDKTWYRVRFGYFSTRDEARAAAAKYGFSRSWIDRIK